MFPRGLKLRPTCCLSLALMTYQALDVALRDEAQHPRTWGPVGDTERELLHDVQQTDDGEERKDHRSRETGLRQVPLEIYL